MRLRSLVFETRGEPSSVKRLSVFNLLSQSEVFRGQCYSARRCFSLPPALCSRPGTPFRSYQSEPPTLAPGCPLPAGVPADRSPKTLHLDLSPSENSIKTGRLSPPPAGGPPHTRLRRNPSRASVRRAPFCAAPSVIWVSLSSPHRLPLPRCRLHGAPPASLCASRRASLPSPPRPRATPAGGWCSETGTLEQGRWPVQCGSFPAHAAWKCVPRPCAGGCAETAVVPPRGDLAASPGRARKGDRIPLGGRWLFVLT